MEEALGKPALNNSYKASTLLSVFRDTIRMGAKHAFLNASPHYFGTPTFDAISHASERLKSARFGDTMTAPIPS